MTPDVHRAVQGPCRSPPPHPQAATSGHRLGRVRGRLAAAGEPDGLWLTEEAIRAWRAEPRTTPGGQPWYSPLAILTALTLRAVFRLGGVRGGGVGGRPRSLRRSAARGRWP